MPERTAWCALLLEEESRGAPPILSGVQARDYPLNATWEKHSYTKIRLQEICNPLLWQETLDRVLSAPWGAFFCGLVTKRGPSAI